MAIGGYHVCINRGKKPCVFSNRHETILWLESRTEEIKEAEQQACPWVWL